MTEINHPPVKYYVLNPDDDADEFLRLFTQLYPEHDVTKAQAILTLADHKPQDDVIWDIIMIQQKP